MVADAFRSNSEILIDAILSDVGVDITSYREVRAG